MGGEEDGFAERGATVSTLRVNHTPKKKFAKSKNKLKQKRALPQVNWLRRQAGGKDQTGGTCSQSLRSSNMAKRAEKEEKL